MLGTVFSIRRAGDHGQISAVKNYSLGFKFTVWSVSLHALSQQTIFLITIFLVFSTINTIFCNGRFCLEQPCRWFFKRSNDPYPTLNIIFRAIFSPTNDNDKKYQKQRLYKTPLDTLTLVIASLNIFSPSVFWHFCPNFSLLRIYSNN